MNKMRLLTSLLALSMGATAQQSDLLFGVTAAKPGEIDWSQIRQLSGNNASNLTLMDAKAPASFVQLRSAKKINPSLDNGAPDPLPAMAGIAALAYDAQHHRLYFSPMFREGGLRYIDLNEKGKTAAVHVFADSYNLIDRQKDGEGKNITRMAIGRGGIGYAISNDGNSFIRFGTDKNATMENMGTLIDHESNGTVSVHNACNGWGGDIVAAATGDLYLFTMRQLVFRIQPETRVATLLGHLKSDDANFSVNGAAVDAEGSIILSSAVQPGKRLVVADISSLEAKANESQEYYNASDLASGNLLFSAKQIQNVAAEPIITPNRNGISVYPNPVTAGKMTIVFENLPKGRYQLDMINLAGINLQTQRVDVQVKGQTTQMQTQRLPKGFYFLRVMNATSQEVFGQKILVK